MAARRLAWFLSLTLAAGLVCSCTNSSTSTLPTTPPSGVVSPSVSQTCGSDTCPPMVLAATQWPDCLNPITECADPDWYWWTVGEQVLPRAMQLDVHGVPQASPLLTEAPTLENGGLRLGPPFVITFHLRTNAIWADGSPLTSGDFAFTWRAILATEGSIWKDRYANIASIDTSDPHTVVIRMNRLDGAWAELFGGARGFILESAAFPGEDPSSPDLSKEMLSEISFSAGPWVLKSWDRHQAVLVANDRSLWPHPLTPRVELLAETNADNAEARIFQGAFGAMYVPTDVLSHLFQGDSVAGPPPTVKAMGTAGTEFDALWFDLGDPPLNDLRVRQAVAYAASREGPIDAIIKQFNQGAAILNCGFVGVPALDTCPSQPFSEYGNGGATSTARGLLTLAGYDCSKRTCVKGGKPLSITMGANQADPFDRETVELLSVFLKDAGSRCR